MLIWKELRDDCPRGILRQGGRRDYSDERTLLEQTLFRVPMPIA